MSRTIDEFYEFMGWERRVPDPNAEPELDKKTQDLVQDLEKHRIPYELEPEKYNMWIYIPNKEFPLAALESRPTEPIEMDDGEVMLDDYFSIYIRNKADRPKGVEIESRRDERGLYRVIMDLDEYDTIRYLKHIWLEEEPS